jgi:hypothetical protein
LPAPNAASPTRPPTPHTVAAYPPNSGHYRQLPRQTRPSHSTRAWVAPPPLSLTVNFPGRLAKPPCKRTLPRTTAKLPRHYSLLITNHSLPTRPLTKEHVAAHSILMVCYKSNSLLRRIPPRIGDGGAGNLLDFWPPPPPRARRVRRRSPRQAPECRGPAAPDSGGAARVCDAAFAPAKW